MDKLLHYDRYMYLHLNNNLSISVQLGYEGIVLSVWEVDKVIDQTYKSYHDFGIEVNELKKN